MSVALKVAKERVDEVVNYASTKDKWSLLLLRQTLQKTYPQKYVHAATEFKLCKLVPVHQMLRPSFKKSSAGKRSTCSAWQTPFEILLGQCSQSFGRTGLTKSDNFGARWSGGIKITKAGVYTFHIGSDDGSLMFVDGEEVTMWTIL
eukprot:3716241-Amphidinium_carterae.1